MCSIPTPIVHPQGGGGRYPFPNWVWSPSGGWWALNPPNWKRRTAFGIAVVFALTGAAARYCSFHEVRCIALRLCAFRACVCACHAYAYAFVVAFAVALNFALCPTPLARRRRCARWAADRHLLSASLTPLSATFLAKSKGAKVKRRRGATAARF